MAIAGREALPVSIVLSQWVSVDGHARNGIEERPMMIAAATARLRRRR